MSSGNILNQERKKTSWDNQLVFFLLGLALIMAPLLRGGNRPLALASLLAIVLAGVAVLAARMSFALVSPARARALEFPPQPAWWWIAIGLLASAPAGIAMLQLVPLPASWWQGLAGRDLYLQALQAAGILPPAYMPLSLNPSATWVSMWTGLCVGGAFVMALCLPSRLVSKLMGVLLVAGCVQVLVAVTQFAAGPASMFYFGHRGGGSFIGTFANRNHLAQFLALLIPVWFYAWLRLRRRQVHAQERRSRYGFVRGKPMLLLIGFSFLVVILSTQSRGGILSAAIVLLASAALVAASGGRGLPRWQFWSLLALAVLVVVAALASVDLQGLLGRVTEDRLRSDAAVRRAMAWATVDAARTFWPWGSGLGTFESVFPRFQPAHLAGYVNHAHNDYVQFLMEAGAFGLIPALALLVLIVRQLRQLIRGRRQQGRLSSELALRCLAGLSVVSLALHGWVEFNMHIPALALAAGLLAGVFLRPMPRQRARNRS